MSEVQVHRQGVIAARKLISEMSCPYPQGSYNARQWWQGAADAVKAAVPPRDPRDEPPTALIVFTTIAGVWAICLVGAAMIIGLMDSDAISTSEFLTRDFKMMAPALVFLVFAYFRIKVLSRRTAEYRANPNLGT